MRASTRGSFVCTASLVLASIAWPARVAEAPSLWHPHFQKRLECQIAKDVTVTVTYQTVTYNGEKAAQLPQGAGWHLANAHFETSAPLTVGGVELAPGRYALKAKKGEDGAWSLVLDEAARFAAKFSDAARDLETEFVADSAHFEHLNIDVQPTGDKDDTTLQLDVRFDRMLARAKIVIPESK